MGDNGKIYRKIGIYGGSFNPPHIAHLTCAQWAVEQLELDLLLFMPSGIPPHKNNKQTISGKYRKDMVELAISDNDKFTMESIEVDTNEKQYTFDTIQKLKAKYPNDQLYFIVGGDMVDYLHTWYRIDELVKLVQFVGMNRPNSTMKTDYPVLLIDSPMLDVSSSLIRERVKTGKSIKYLVNDDVIAYIEREKLYMEA